MVGVGEFKAVPAGRDRTRGRIQRTGQEIRVPETLLLYRLRFQISVAGPRVGLLQAVSRPGPPMILLQVLPYQLDGDGAPPGAGVRLRIVAERVEVRQVLLDKREGLLLIAPAAREIGLATRGLAHALEDGGRERLQLRLPGADHVDDRARGLGEFGYVFLGHQAGVAR